MNLDGYDFLDFGASKGGSIDFALRHLGGTRGIGIDLAPKKVDLMLNAGYDCLQGDITKLDFPSDSVRFVVMSHLLEHLPDLQAVENTLRSAARVASDFLFIQGPYFDADEFLRNQELKFYWSDWHGHPCHLTTSQLRKILLDLELKDFVIMGCGTVTDSFDSAIHPLGSPRDQHAYDPEVHPGKPFVNFRQPLYKEMVCYVRLRPFIDWKNILQARKGCEQLNVDTEQRRTERFSIPSQRTSSASERPLTKIAQAETQDTAKRAVSQSLDNLKSDAPIPDHIKNRKIELFKFAFQWLLESLPIEPKNSWVVLEAGQGKYGWSELYQNFFDTVYGADLEDYSGFHPGVTSIQANFCEHIPLPDQSVDFIVSHSVLEHVLDVPSTLANFDRILKVGGFVFITISPLYYSAEGSHVNNPVKLSNWEHLDSASEHYLLDNPYPKSPVGGHALNKMTFSDFIGWVGQFPWSIERTRLAIDHRPIPEYVDVKRWLEMNLRTKGFFLLARKQWHCNRSHISQESAGQKLAAQTDAQDG